MKRSKMYKEILKVIQDNDQSCSCCGPTETEESATLVLAKILELGMIPPETVRYTDHDNGNTSCAEVCEWDDENE